MTAKHTPSRRMVELIDAGALSRKDDCLGAVKVQWRGQFREHVEALRNEVNAHDALLEAARAAEDALSDVPSRIGDSVENAIGKLRTAIAAATGEGVES